MILIFVYIILYYNIDKIVQNIYLPYIISSSNYNIDMISSNKELYFLLSMTGYFMLLLYAYMLIDKLFFSKSTDWNCIGLSIIHIKHIIDIITNPNMKMIEYELNRSIAQAITTPLMLKMYCDANNITIYDINIHYHIIPVFLQIFMITIKNQYIYIVLTALLYIFRFYFIKSLYKYKQLPFTNIYTLIWSIFMIINILDITKIFNPIYIYALYNLSDTLCKFICNIIISYYNEQKIFIKENMDLQSVNFISQLLKYIKQFEENNKKLSPFCDSLLVNLREKLLCKIPDNNYTLKIDLLKKILPFGFDKDYLTTYVDLIENTYLNKELNVDFPNNSSENTHKKFDFICVLFMDIVNYTEIAKKYNEEIIFNLLNNIYNNFDNIIKKYSHLQKIETIGDAYMVVGDIFRNNENYIIVVKEIILLAIDYIKIIKKIKTPDKVPLSIRIGINIGPIIVGILGNEIPRLCVVGNTVNMASRLQSTADKDSIQISKNVYVYIKDIDFDFNIKFNMKENVFLKNIGDVITYNISPLSTI